MNEEPREIFGLNSEVETTNVKVDSLLRLFQSEYFDAHLHMTYLYKMEAPGVHTYLVNELYKFTDEDIDYYLPQLCHLNLVRSETSDLSRFLLDKAGKSMHFALKVHWLVQAAVEDQVPRLQQLALQLWQETEMAMVNSTGDSVDLSPPRRPEPKNEASTLKVSRSVPELGKENNSEEETPPTSARDSGHLVAEPSKEGARRESFSLRSFSLRSLSNLKGLIKTAEDRAVDLEVELTAPNALIDLGPAIRDNLPLADSEGIDQALKPYLIKKQLCDYFNLENFFISYLLKLGGWLVTLKRPQRQLKLQRTLMLLNQWLFERRFHVYSSGCKFALSTVHVPLLFGQNTRLQLLRVHTGECKVFSSKKRAPFLLMAESADLDEEPAPDYTEADDYIEADDDERAPSFDAAFIAPTADLTSNSAPSSPTLGDRRIGRKGLTVRLQGGLGVRERAIRGRDAVLAEVRLRMMGAQVPGTVPQCLPDLTPEEWYRINLTEPCPSAPRIPKEPRCANCDAKRDSAQSDEDWIETPEDDLEEDKETCLRCRRDREAVRARYRLWPELFEDKVNRLRQSSPFGDLPSWKVAAYIVKAGDDVRQELLASQLIHQFLLIFKAAGLNLWLRPIEVLVTSSDSGLIEFVQNSISVDAMKQNFVNEKGSCLSLARIFRIAFGDNLFEAKKNFIESLAAYSLVSYFLQVKDRHNGNILLDSKGHLMHIDFGFMLSNAPGGNFSIETAPFKLTQEFLDVMDGEGSEQYEYFRTLVINGFLAARKHWERIALPISMMMHYSKFPCMAGGPDVVFKGLEDRFFLRLTEAACAEKVADLIDQSANSWATKQYDQFQRVFTGIQ